MMFFQSPNYITSLCIVVITIMVLSIHNSHSIKFDSAPRTIYDALTSHGLPIGLLPKGVSNFSIDSDSGKFRVFLDQACNAKFESELHYDRNVSGVLSYGRIEELSGISAQELFLWFPVKGIHVDVPSTGIIYFDVGVVFKQLSLSLFETPPECTAVSPAGAPDREDGKLIADAVFKSQNGKLRYQLDQDDVMRASS